MMSMTSEREDADESITPKLELAILRFWAAAMHMERNFRRQEIDSIPELSRAIEAVQLLPAAIGWDDVLSTAIKDASET